MTTPPPPLESDIKPAIRQWLTLTGWYVVNMFQGAKGIGATVHKGIADLYALRGGRSLWLEVKRPKKGVQSEYQKDFEQSIIDHGGEYYLVTSVEDVMQITAPHVGVKEGRSDG